MKFIGEPAEDEGGVKKEFFLLLVREVFKLEYTMFKETDGHYIWFNSKTFEDKLKFELVGIIMGLAIYNGVILDLHFPIACYKKLLDIEVGIEDLKDLYPQMASSLQHILKDESENLEELLYQPFIVEEEFFGEIQVHELKENGKNIFVN